MGSGEVLDRAQVRTRLSKETGLAVLEAMDQGFTVRAQGHGVKIFCPCKGPHTRSVAGTPRNDGNEAKRVRRTILLCPVAQTNED